MIRRSISITLYAVLLDLDAISGNCRAMRNTFSNIGCIIAS